MKVSWRTGAVLLEEEISTKPFACQKAADRVDGPRRVFRVKTNDTDGSNRSGHHRHRIPGTGRCMAFLDQSPLFDVAVVSLCRVR